MFNEVDALGSRVMVVKRERTHLDISLVQGTELVSTRCIENFKLEA